jgi:hypothetical protein
MSKEDEIQKKLIELELAIEQEDKSANVPAKSPASSEIVSLDSIAAKKEAADLQLNADINLFVGIALLVTGILMVFAHVQVGTGMLLSLGFGPKIGILILPMLIGIGMLFYDYRWRLAQAVTAGGIALILFTLLTQLVITFPMVSMLGLLFMVLPIVAGCGFVAKAAQKQRQLKQIGGSEKNQIQPPDGNK